MTLHDKIAIAALPFVLNEEIHVTAADAAKALGIDAADYNHRTHWPLFVARRCYAVADAFEQVRKERVAPEPTTPSLEPLFATADAVCRDEPHPPGDWTEGGAYHAVTAEERKMDPRPRGVEFWDSLECRWFLADTVPEPCNIDTLYRVPNKGGAK